jgi:hypothetical protein
MSLGPGWSSGGEHEWINDVTGGDMLVLLYPPPQIAEAEQILINRAGADCQICLPQLILTKVV